MVKMYEHCTSCEFVFLKEMFLLNYVVRKEAFLGIVVYFCAVTRVRSFLVLNMSRIVRLIFGRKVGFL